jgi:hypothetical protein
MSSEMPFLFGNAYTRPARLAVMQQMLDAELFNLMPPATTYDRLDATVKKACETHYYYDFWVQRTRALNGWAYDRAQPPMEQAFAFWWRLCAATEQLWRQDPPTPDYESFHLDIPAARAKNFAQNLAAHLRARAVPFEVHHPGKPVGDPYHFAVVGSEDWGMAAICTVLWSNGSDADVFAEPKHEQRFRLKHAVMLGFDLLHPMYPLLGSPKQQPQDSMQAAVTAAIQELEGMDREELWRDDDWVQQNNVDSDLLMDLREEWTTRLLKLLADYSAQGTVRRKIHSAPMPTPRQIKTAMDSAEFATRVRNNALDILHHMLAAVLDAEDDGLGCSVCSTPTRLGCEGCGAVRYCSVDCQRGDYEKHSTVCALIAGKDDMVFLFSGAFGPQDLLAVLQMLSDAQIYARMPPAPTYDELNTNVKTICASQELRWFWKQRVQGFNLWAYERVQPSEDKIFEFWWSLCAATEALWLVDSISVVFNSVKVTLEGKWEFILAYLDRVHVYHSESRLGAGGNTAKLIIFGREWRERRDDTALCTIETPNGEMFISTPRLSSEQLTDLKIRLRHVVVLGLGRTYIIKYPTDSVKEKVVRRFPILQLD